MVRYCLCLCLLALLLCPPARADHGLIFSTQPIAPYSMADKTGFFDVLFQELGRRAGFKVMVVQQPDKRSLDLTNRGVNDADGPRIPGLERQYPDLVRVDEPLLMAELVAFARKGTRYADWNDLAGRQAALPVNWSLPEGKLPQSAQIVEVMSSHQGMAMLDVGRIDAAMTLLRVGRREIARHQFTHVDPDPPVLYRQPLYLYLHRKHVALIPAITEALRAMKEDGTWDRLHALATAPPAK